MPDKIRVAVIIIFKNNVVNYVVSNVVLLAAKVRHHGKSPVFPVKSGF